MTEQPWEVFDRQFLDYVDHLVVNAYAEAEVPEFEEWLLYDKIFENPKEG